MQVTESLPIVSKDSAIQGAYERLRAAGQTHLIAEMLAFRKPPGLNGSERAFFENRLLSHGFDECDPLADTFISEAKASGIDITGKVYQSTIADHRAHLDPQAWVSDTHDVIATAKERNLNLRGSVRVDAITDLDPTPDIPLADDIVEREIKTLLATDPTKRGSDPRELREEVIDKSAPKWSTADL